jgi:hypothetical protein
MTQQQHMLQEQQQQLASMQEQLTQLKDMHKKKLVRYKAQLQQQYEAQLAAATTAYTQELSLVHVSGWRYYIHVVSTCWGAIIGISPTAAEVLQGSYHQVGKCTPPDGPHMYATKQCFQGLKSLSVQVIEPHSPTASTPLCCNVSLCLCLHRRCNSQPERG